MKQALIVADEIYRMQKAMHITKSEYLKRDYAKNIKLLKKELKEYCGYKGLEYDKIIMYRKEKNNGNNR
jgi:hypothetical protein